MRAAPALAVRVERFGVWHAMLGALLAASIAALSLWCWQRDDQRPGAVAAAAVLALLVIVAAGSCLRRSAIRLRWDGAHWHVDAQGAGSPGELRVAIDLGGWMLLRFTPAAGRTHWLPVQRRGLEAHWHALRCALYSARPELPDTTADRTE